MSEHHRANVRQPFTRKQKAVASLLALFAALGVGKKAYEYAAPPLADKDCTYEYPHADDRGDAASKPNAQAVKPAFVTLGGVVNDASCLNRGAVFGVARVQTEADVGEALAYARKTGLAITSAGTRHSMGGQSFRRGGLVLDMKGLNWMTLDKKAMTLRVQSGATWADAQRFLDKEGLSVKAMQSINIFTVGGTLSVNAHGIAHDPGQVAPTVRALRVMLADGTTVRATPTENAELFRHALGGYGLFGVILDAELDVVPNEVYAWSVHRMPMAEVPAFIERDIAGNKKVGLAYGRLTVNDGAYLQNATFNVYRKTAHDGPLPALAPPETDWLRRFVINFSKTGATGRWFRTVMERRMEPRVHACVSRAEAMSGDVVCNVARNQEMYDAMGYLKNRLPDTDILQEYFLPPKESAAFVDELRETVRRNGANLLNVTIRIVHEDKTTALPYAKGERLAFVLYFNQRFTDRESEILRRTTSDLVDAAIARGGSFYLPYQLAYSPEQLRAAYPEIDAFFATKGKFDPAGLFTNEWHAKYGPRA